MINLNKVLKSDVVTLMAELKKKNFSNEDIAVMLKRTTQTVYAWGAKTEAMKNRIPCLAEFNALKHLLEK